MTQPTEAAIRQACEEAGVNPQNTADLTTGEVMQKMLTALARRIEAERAGAGADHSAHDLDMVPQPDAQARIAELEGEQACKNCGFVPEKSG